MKNSLYTISTLLAFVIFGCLEKESAPNSQLVLDSMVKVETMQTIETQLGSDTGIVASVKHSPQSSDTVRYPTAVQQKRLQEILIKLDKAQPSKVIAGQHYNNPLTPDEQRFLDSAQTAKSKAARKH